MSASHPPRNPLDPYEPSEPVAKPSVPSMGQTRLSATWKVLAAALIFLVLLLVFILLNSQRVQVNFYGAHTYLPLAVALLLASAFGGILVFVIGTARILQVRARARRAGSPSPS